MRVALYPSDKTGCGRYRVNLPGEAAKAEGVDCWWASDGSEDQGLKISKITVPGGVRIKPEPVDAEVLVMQRVAHKMTALAVRMLQDLGYAVVIDIDDDLSALPTGHPAVRQLSPRQNPDCNWEIMKESCRAADLVTVTSPALVERYGRHGRVMVLPNCVPEKLLDLEPSGDGNTVGWAGFTVTHPGDLRAAGGGIAEVVRSGARFLQVGPGIGVREQLSLDEEPEVMGPLPEIDDYYEGITRLDVGIAPLLDTKFNAAKSYLKPLEYAACGVPFVASPVSEYRRFHEEGVGLLAEYRGRSWKRAVARLLSDDSLREELIQQGTDLVADRHTYERQGWKWAEAWQIARDNADARLATGKKLAPA